jgi:hypothetical protein
LQSLQSTSWRIVNPYGCAPAGNLKWSSYRLPLGCCETPWLQPKAQDLQFRLQSLDSPLGLIGRRATHALAIFRDSALRHGDMAILAVSVAWYDQCRTA